MALDPDSGRVPLQRGVPALLQAVGQLLIAMAGADFPEYEAPPRRPAGRPPPAAARRRPNLRRVSRLPTTSSWSSPTPGRAPTN